jgi:hypothetical protein
MIYTGVATYDWIEDFTLTIIHEFLKFFDGEDSWYCTADTQNKRPTVFQAYLQYNLLELLPGPYKRILVASRFLARIQVLGPSITTLGRTGYILEYSGPSYGPRNTTVPVLVPRLFL